MFNSMQALWLFVILAYLPVAQLTAEDPKPTLELRLAEDAESSGWQKMELRGSDSPIYVSDTVVLNGGHIEKVTFYKDLDGNPIIGFSLTDDGARAMETITSQNLRKKLVIVLNGEVVSAPIIQSTIKKEGQITGRFDKDDLLAFFHAIVLYDLPKTPPSR